MRLSALGSDPPAPDPPAPDPPAPKRIEGVGAVALTTSVTSESLFQKPYAVVRLRDRLYRNRSRYFAPVSRRSIN